MSGFTVSTTVTVSLDQVASLLVSAMEGGSNYWYWLNEKVAPVTWEFKAFDDEQPERWYCNYPLNRGGALIFSVLEDEDEKAYRLDSSALEKGLRLMAETQPDQFAAVLEDTADAETGDVFLQLALFGDVVYC